ncbi:hypothetical protein MKK70_27335 [Methylobacterium sp. E-041]|uniref:PD-(D/E)XK nuclease family protein n=1 Tax=Methylobacterium sp. E-041 TaxID=2836573 RepID=UPI001FBB8DC9|nr:PD-(D/E)XK nuclease family protein [Methylobacterium sp. E-041]MCJ2109015.1 hypothetical protein [Methylobacterium sp. E-041]
MAPSNTAESDLLLPSAIRLALERFDAMPDLVEAWGPVQATLIRAEAARQLTRQADAAAILGDAAGRLTERIALIPYLEPGGAFGPAWAGHPFASPAMQAGYKLREPDITRALAALMGPAAGARGGQRAIGFLRLITAGPRTAALHAVISDGIRPRAIAECPITPSRGACAGTATGSARRIDLLFEWPFGNDGRRAVVAVEAKLDAVVSAGQLSAYRAEARRRARGGPVGLVLLTGWADTAERRHPAWAALRWFALLRRWESVLAEAGDSDPEFTRVRAHLWKFVLTTKRAHQ